MKKLTKEERESRFYVLAEVSPLNHGALAIEQQDAREGPLVAAMRRAMADLRTGRISFMDISLALEMTLAQYDALDAAPEPSLLEAAKAMVSSYHDDTRIVGVDIAHFITLKAAVEREEGKR